MRQLQSKMRQFSADEREIVNSVPAVIVSVPPAYTTVPSQHEQGLQLSRSPTWFPVHYSLISTTTGQRSYGSLSTQSLIEFRLVQLLNTWSFAVLAYYVSKLNWDTTGTVFFLYFCALFILIPGCVLAENKLFFHARSSSVTDPILQAIRRGVRAYREPNANTWRSFKISRSGLHLKWKHYLYLLLAPAIPMFGCCCFGMLASSVYFTGRDDFCIITSHNTSDIVLLSPTEIYDFVYHYYKNEDNENVTVI